MITFHRMLLPDGRSQDLEEGLGLDQFGAIGVKDRVNRHIGSKIMTVATLSGLSALAAGGTSYGYNVGYGDYYRQQLSAQTAQVGQQSLNKQLNRPNSLTVFEGKIFDLRLSHDVYMREWME